MQVYNGKPMNFSSMVRRDQGGVSHYQKKTGMQVDSYKSSYGTLVHNFYLSNNYPHLFGVTVVLMADGNDEFRVVPVKDWFKFSAPIRHRVLTVEEAEDAMKSRKRQVQRWHMKNMLIGNTREDEEEEKPKKKRLMKFGGKAQAESAKADKDDPYTVRCL